MRDLSAALGRGEEVLAESWRVRFAIARQTARRVQAAFRTADVREQDFAPSVGYGYGDRGRDRLDEVFALSFGCEAALVRTQIASGTHALAVALLGVLNPGDELLIATGIPYDTLQAVLGLRPTPRSLREMGIGVRVLPMGEGLDPDRLAQAIGDRTKAVLFQRSRGYSEREGLTPEAMAPALGRLRTLGVTSVVDNCYGEFVCAQEPEADLLVGSLTKNPGGGLAPGGGYIAGRRRLVEAAADRLTAPGLGGHVGAFPGGKRELFQGLYLAPHAVAEALTAADYAAAVGEALGLSVAPGPLAPRGDIVQTITFGSAQALLRFGRALQSASPVDSRALPEPAELPGYSHAVVMAGGTFIAGASLELSMDAPMRPPYVGYLQGGLSAAHSVEALRAAFTAAFAEG